MTITEVPGAGAGVDICGGRRSRLGDRRRAGWRDSFGRQAKDQPSKTWISRRKQLMNQLTRGLRVVRTTPKGSLGATPAPGSTGRSERLAS